MTAPAMGLTQKWKLFARQLARPAPSHTALIKVDNNFLTMGDSQKGSHFLNHHLFTDPARHSLDMVAHLVSNQESYHRFELGFRFTNLT